jgi:hypothetical protein
MKCHDPKTTILPSTGLVAEIAVWQDRTGLSDFGEGYAILAGTNSGQGRGE